MRPRPGVVHGEGCEVILYQREDKSYYLEIMVKSQVRPRIARHGIIEFNVLPAKQQLQKVGLTGAVLAEELCEKYGDTLTPETTGRACQDAYLDLMKDPKVAGIGGQLPRAADALIIANPDLAGDF